MRQWRKSASNRKWSVAERESQGENADRQSFIEDLFALSEATRRLAVARTIADPELSARLVEIADGLARMARIEARLSRFVDGLAVFPVRWSANLLNEEVARRECASRCRRSVIHVRLMQPAWARSLPGSMRRRLSVGNDATEAGPAHRLQTCPDWREDQVTHEDRQWWDW
jgi:hypothetical protein